MKITELVAGLAAEPAAKVGCFVWDVEWIKEGGERYLRVSIDNDAAQVDVDQCEAVSRALDAKLDEELAEYQESKSMEELADLLEVVRAVALARGSSPEEVEEIRRRKAEKRGGFEKKILLEEVSEP